MLRIACPYCGVRDHSEFSYGGDATKVRPEQSSTDPDAWIDFVYVRDNPRGRHWEYWHHVHGCRQWLRVERDTLTHEIFRVLPARGGVRTSPGTGNGAGDAQ